MICRCVRRSGATIAAALTVLNFATTASAQLKGHYIPGFTGLDNGTQPPPGISVAVPVFAYPTDTIKDNAGRPLAAQPSITASFVGVGLAVVTNAKLFGARYGGQIIPVDWMKSRIEGASLNVPGSFSVSDIYVQPLWLGWSTPRADYSAGYGFFGPTGKWKLGAMNAGLGMWSNDFQAGTTIHLDKKREWATSGLMTFEVHSHKEGGSDLRVGNILTLEGGTGRAFYTPVQDSPIPRIITLGLAYYGQFKVSADSGAVVQPLDTALGNDRDRVFGVGGEANVFLPKAKLLFDARIIPEFGARNRTQGLTMVFTIGYQMKSLVKAGKQP